MEKNTTGNYAQKRHIQLTFCHRKPERSFFWKGKQFPVCARCTGIFLGYFSFPFFLFDIFAINIWWTLALILPTYIDGWSQVFLDRSSNNFLRFTSGFIAGIGIMSLVTIIGQFLGNFILSLLH